MYACSSRAVNGVGGSTELTGAAGLTPLRQGFSIWQPSGCPPYNLLLRFAPMADGPWRVLGVDQG